jgi:hypothetical protein
MKGSSVLWIKYHRNGKPIRESAHTTKVKEAEKLLRQRMAAISTGTYVGPKLEKTRVAELADDLIREYRINGRKSIDDLAARWKLHLEPFFGALRAIEVSSQLVARYIDVRQQERAENATINPRTRGAEAHVQSGASVHTSQGPIGSIYRHASREQHSHWFPRKQAA